MQFIRKCLGVPGVEEDIEIALFEALENAVVHGNHEDPGKQVRVGCRCGTDEVSIVIRDEGQGFDIDEVPDPTSPENIQSSHGRGTYLMRTRCMKFALNEVVQLSICESPPGSYDAEELVLKTADSTDMGWWLT
jgi:anti-sigma regulatory factor (Ser/Thr protein kinase)